MGGLDPSWLDLAFSGRPDFPSRGPKTLQNRYLGTSGLKIGVPQKMPISTTTDSTPHLRPSEQYDVQGRCNFMIVFGRRLYFSKMSISGCGQIPERYLVTIHLGRSIFY